MKQLFDRVSKSTSRLITRTYSTSFSIGIYCLGRRFHDPIYSVYGFVRLADEIVDSMHGYDREQLLNDFERETYQAIERRISMNPVLNAFQEVVHQYDISNDMVESFLKSMRYDLTRTSYNQEDYQEYIYGSAEVVGLMCLRVFAENRVDLYNELKPYAMKLGAAFQKVNFLRDLQSDNEYLGRMYFPGVSMEKISESEKMEIERDIQSDFDDALEGIKNLPRGARLGVYVAYAYYRKLFAAIRSLPSESIKKERIRIPNYRKLLLLFGSYFRHSFNMI